MRERIVALLIDPDPWAASAVEAALRSGRCPAFPLSLVQAADLDDGLGMLEADAAIGLVLLGLRASGIGRPEAVRRLQAASPGVSVVGIVDAGDEDLGLRAMDLGADSYVVRGAVEPGDLRRQLCAIVQQRRLSKGLSALTHRLERRRHQVELKDEFLAAFSHDCRTPLTVIHTALTCLEESLRGRLNEEQHEFLRMSESNCDRMLRLVDNLLELTRLERGRRLARTTSFDAASAARSSVRAFRLLAPSRRVVIAEDYAPGLPLLRADPDLFVELLDNLLSNALRYARQRITVSAALDPGGVRVTVADDGPGISKHDQRRLFRKFGHAGPVRDAGGYRGSGLGLAICKQIVRRQHGRIWLDSAPGKGARLHFVLPCCGAQGAAREGTASTGAGE